MAMTTAPKRLLERAVRDQKAATALEFALIAVPLVGLILFTLQLTIVSFFDQTLQTAAEKSARQLMTGSAQLSNLSQSGFKNVVCANATQFSCSGLMVDVQSTSSFSQVSTTSLTPTYDASGNVTNSWSYNPGAAGDIVIMRVMYDWPIVGGPFGYGLANQPNGTFLMVATAVFKNEPYQ
jgi:Flp pilus assembly protein TadG